MQFERLRKNHRKQIIIGALAICAVGGALTFSLTRAKYEIANDLELAKGTINYKAYDFKIMAMYQSDDKTNYTEIEEMPSEGYVINESKSYCNMSNGDKDTTAILKTIDSNHIISKLKKNDKCFIYFDKKTTASETILANLGTDVKTTTPDFSQTATTDEGVFITDDPMYGTNAKTYYWRGAATTNHVIFANKCWRIVRINGDKSLRLIYNGYVQMENTCTGNGLNSEGVIMGSSSSEKYYATNEGQANKSYYVGWTYAEGKQRPEEGDMVIDSNAKTQAEKWYDSNIKNNRVYSYKVAKGKFCNDRNVQNESSWSVAGGTFNYSGNKRLRIDYSPILSCSQGDIYELNVGLITADEVELAGGRDKNNTSYYLYNGQNYWTLSPHQWYSYNNGFASVFYVNVDGHLASDYVDGTRGLRPVINLRSDVTFSDGNGTQSNPYVVS